jgi:hypothetical protein
MNLTVRLQTGDYINIVDSSTGLIREFDLSDESTWRDFFGLTEERRSYLEQRYRRRPRSNALRRAPIYGQEDLPADDSPEG